MVLLTFYVLAAYYVDRPHQTRNACIHARAAKINATQREVIRQGHLAQQIQFIIFHQCNE